MADNVNHPAHYETGRFECIDVMVETQGGGSNPEFLRVQCPQVHLPSQEEERG